MAGNRKQGFMRGNKNGRNGVGVQKSFHCDACEKDHGASVERTGMKYLIGRDVLICDRKYFKLKDCIALSNHKEKNLKTLKSLSSKIGVSGANGLKARIKFVCVVFTSGLGDSLLQGDFFDKYELSERDYDRCFEMFDSKKVIYGVVKESKSNYWLKLSLEKYLDASTLNAWMNTFNEIESLEE